MNHAAKQLMMNAPTIAGFPASDIVDEPKRSAEESVRPSSANAIDTGVHIRLSRLSDIALIFNLIQSGAIEGVFSNLYLLPRYQAGLGLQLLSCFYLKRIKFPDGIRYRMEMKSVWVGSEFAGFSIVRRIGNDPARLEIYLCAVVPEFRRMGVGKTLVTAAVDSVPCDGRIEASCVTNAIGMKALLRKAGFMSVATQHAAALQIAPETFLFTHQGFD